MMTLLSSEQKDYAELLVENYEQTRPDVYFLALITSPARKIEPELLRALRLKLADYFPSGAKPSVETESALWFSSLVESRGSDSITLLPGVLDLLRERLKAQPVELLEKIRSIIKECHQSVPPVIGWEEDLIYYSLIPAQDIHRRTLIRYTVLMAAKAVLSGKRPGLEEWINGMIARVPAEISEHEDFKTLLLLSQTKIRRTKILSNPSASSAASDDRILKIKLRENEMEIGDAAEADFQIGVPKLTPVTIIVREGSDPENWRSHIIPPEGTVQISFPPRENRLLLQTIDGRVYEVPLREAAAPQAEASEQISEADEPLSPTRPLNEAKIIVLGDSGVGKSALIQRLVTNTFEPTESTKGIQITQWMLDINEEQIRLNIWDMGGQSIYRGLTKLLLTPRSLYLVVIDGRGSEAEKSAEYWLNLVRDFPEAPVILVAGRSDIFPPDINLRSLREKYPNLIELIKTDSLHGGGISMLHRRIQDAVSGMENLRQPIPLDWFNIKEEISSRRRNYLHASEFRKICEAHNEANERNQDVLAALLHEFGYIFSWGENSGLSELMVLNVEWLSNGIFDILNSNIARNLEGQISLADIRSILHRNNYPHDTHSFLLEAMSKAELCFRFGNDESLYLVPTLLPGIEPFEAQQFKPEESLNFEYHYETLPDSVLPRFIAGTASYNNRRQRWREGVILERSDARALVKADAAQQKIRILINGDTKARQEFLTMIRLELTQIHQSLDNLTVQEMVPIPAHPGQYVAYENLLNLEESGQQTIEVFIGKEQQSFRVSALLNGFDIDETANQEADRKLRVFCSYADKDVKFYRELERHLSILRRQNLIDFWDESQLVPGDEIAPEILRHLERADIILLLISADYLSSQKYDSELLAAVEQYKINKAVILPIIVRPCLWQETPLAEFEVFPEGGKALSNQKKRDDAWLKITQRIRQLVDEIKTRSSAL